MPLYLTKFSYTPETWARLIANPEDRRSAATALALTIGLTVVSAVAVTAESMKTSVSEAVSGVPSTGSTAWTVAVFARSVDPATAS